MANQGGALTDSLVNEIIPYIMSAEQTPKGLRERFKRILERGSSKSTELSPRQSSPVPVFELSANNVSEHILVNKDEQEWLMRNVAERITEYLSPTAAALDAMYKDNLYRSENMLMSNKKGELQFVLGNIDKDNQITIVSMKGHKIKSPNGEKEIGCQSAVFCKTSTANLAYFQENFVQVVEKRGDFRFDKLPEASESGAIGIVINQKDEISDVAYLGGLPFLPSEPPRGMFFPPYGMFSKETTWHYKIADKDFAAKGIYEYKLIEGNPREPFHLDYIPDQKGSFVRKIDHAGRPLLLSVPIEQEIKTIIEKLPFQK